MSATFCILDALDEAPTTLQLDLLTKLASLNIKLFITSRPMKALESYFPDAHFFPIIARDDDLELHIRTEMARSPELSAILKRADASLQAHILSSIKTNSAGM